MSCRSRVVCDVSPRVPRGEGGVALWGPRVHIDIYILHGYVEQDETNVCVCLCAVVCVHHLADRRFNSHGHTPLPRGLSARAAQTGSPSLLGGGGASGATLPSALPSTVPITLSRAAAGTSAGSAQPLVHTEAGRADRGATLWEGGGGFAQPTVRAAARADLIPRGGRPHQSLGRALCGQGRGARWSARSGGLTPLCQRRGGPPGTRNRQGGKTPGARPFAGRRVLGVGGRVGGGGERCEEGGAPRPGYAGAGFSEGGCVAVGGRRGGRRRAAGLAAHETDDGKGRRQARTDSLGLGLGFLLFLLLLELSILLQARQLVLPMLTHLQLLPPRRERVWVWVWVWEVWCTTLAASVCACCAARSASCSSSDLAPFALLRRCTKRRMVSITMTAPAAMLNCSGGPRGRGRWWWW